MASVSCDELLQDHSDTKLFQYLAESRQLVPSSRLSLLSTNLVAKQYEPNEVEDAVHAIACAQQLGIPTPRIRRVITDQQNAYCIMDRIEGTTLEHMWPRLGWFLTVKVALQLRRNIKHLRSVTSSTAGSLVSGECRSFWLDNHYGLPPKSKSADVAYFFRFWATFTTVRNAMQAAIHGKISDSEERSCLESKNFVFTHHDLAPRNILLAPSGQIWILDWDFAGFYLIYFEYASMQNFEMPKEWTIWAQLRWCLFTSFTVGRYEQSARMLRHIRSKFMQFPVGRRFELLKMGGPSRYPVS